jgi:hypothetical protein
MALAQAQADPAAASSIGDALNSDSSFLSTLDPAIARPFQEGYVASTQLVYIIGGIIMVIAFLLVLAMKELPLRTQSALEERMAEQAAELALSDEALSGGSLSGEGASGESGSPVAVLEQPTEQGAGSDAPIDDGEPVGALSGSSRHGAGRHSDNNDDLVPAWELVGDTANPGAGRHRA